MSAESIAGGIDYFLAKGVRQEEGDPAYKPRKMVYLVVQTTSEVPSCPQR